MQKLLMPKGPKAAHGAGPWAGPKWVQRVPKDANGSENLINNLWILAKMKITCCSYARMRGLMHLVRTMKRTNQKEA